MPRSPNPRSMKSSPTPSAKPSRGNWRSSRTSSPRSPRPRRSPSRSSRPIPSWRTTSAASRSNVTLPDPRSLQEIDQRMKDLRFRPDTQDLASYPYADFRGRPQDRRAQPAGECVHVCQHRSPKPACGSSATDEWHAVRRQREDESPAGGPAGDLASARDPDRSVRRRRGQDAGHHLHRAVAGGDRRLHLAAVRHLAVRPGGDHRPVPRRLDRSGRDCRFGVPGHDLHRPGPADRRLPDQRHHDRRDPDPARLLAERHHRRVRPNSREPRARCN